MGNRDTDADLLKRHFSATNWSRVISEKDKVDSALLTEFLSSYWRPAYLYIRRDRAKSNEEAKDLTQAFFIHIIENKVLTRYRPEQGRLRTFLKVALKNFLTDKQRRQNALRRGGGRSIVSFDDMEVDRLEGMASSPESPDDLFDREWAYDLMVEAVEAVQSRLKKAGKDAYWKVYEMYDLDPPPEGRPTYRQIGESLGMSEEKVTKHLAHVRREIRQELLDRVGQQVTGEEELYREMKDLLGE